MLDDYLPVKVNTGPWVTAYTLNRLRDQASPEFVLPICSIATEYTELCESGKSLLPPIFHEALDEDLRGKIIGQIRRCFPDYSTTTQGRSEVRVVEFAEQIPVPCERGKIIAFSIDTAVEQHGPHLPLATDTIQSYSVLRELETACDEVKLCRPLEYGQLTWGLPFGFSIDLTADLLTEYVRRYVNALVDWQQPKAAYVVDVHGSITHRKAIVAGLQASKLDLWTFRWLYEPLAPFASQRGDQHAGGVETALVHRVSNELLDPSWWPNRIDELAAGQMSFAKAVELTPDLDAFVAYARDHALNGIVGDISNFFAVDAEEMFQRMVAVARKDIETLMSGNAEQSAGEDLW